MYLQMQTVKKLKNSKGTKPYSVPLKVKVAAVGQTQRYQTDSGERKEYLIVGLADTTDFIKAVVYDTSKLAGLSDSSSVILMNYIYKNEAEASVIITKNTKVMKTAPLDVPEYFLERAKSITNPPPAETLPLKDVKKSPVKTLVSVKGRIISVS
jgi:hypothetical protein